MQKRIAKLDQYSRALGKRTAMIRVLCNASVLFALIGCDEIPPPDEPEIKPIEIGAKFVPGNTGTISGRVVWSGPVPEVPPFRVAVPIPGGRTESREIPNPNAPRINPQTGAVAGAVVYLEQIDSDRAKPWDYRPVRVEMQAEAIRIMQGESPRPVGFVRQGEDIEMVSRDAVMQSLCVRGAAFFALAFPDPDRPLRRRLDKAGLVELSSGMGHFWWHSYLFVGRHPYYTWTDDDGRFSLTQVPAGDLRVVCWRPNPKIARTERDPNTIGILRIEYEKPVERVAPIRLEARDEKQMEIRLSSE